MKMIFKQSNILIALLVLVNTLPPSSMRLVLVFLVIVLSIKSAYRVNVIYDNLYLKGLNYLIVLLSIYGLWLILSAPIILGMSGERVSNTSYITTIFLSLLPIYSFYYYTRKGELTLEDLRRWLPVLIIVTTYQYYQNQASLLNIVSDTRYNLEITNNVGYVFLSLIPLLTIYKDKPIIQYSALVYCIAFLMMSMKRGAMVIAIVCVILFFIGNKERSSKLKSLIFFLILLCVIYWLYINILSSNDYFLNKTEQAGGSGRTDIFSLLWNTYACDYSFWEELFGRGANSSILVAGNYAHNDWLELLINQGIVGVIFYLVYWKNFLHVTLSVKRCRKFFYPLLILFVITLLKSFFSMSYSGMSYIECIAIGYFIAQSDNSRMVHYL